MDDEAKIIVRQSTLKILEEIRRQMEDYDGVINRLINRHIDIRNLAEMYVGPSPLWKLFNIEEAEG